MVDSTSEKYTFNISYSILTKFSLKSVPGNNLTTWTTYTGIGEYGRLPLRLLKRKID